jgi:hypothetical protein
VDARLLLGRKIALLAMFVVFAGCDATSEPSEPPIGPQAATIDQLLGPWSRTPFVPPPALLASADRACKAALGPDSSHHIELMELKVVDVRGTGVAQAFLEAANGDAQAACYEMSIAPDGTVAATGGGGSSGGVSSGPIAPPDPHH